MLENKRKDRILGGGGEIWGEKRWGVTQRDSLQYIKVGGGGRGELRGVGGDG